MKYLIQNLFADDIEILTENYLYTKISDTDFLMNKSDIDAFLSDIKAYCFKYPEEENQAIEWSHNVRYGNWNRYAKRKMVQITFEVLGKHIKNGKIIITDTSGRIILPRMNENLYIFIDSSPLLNSLHCETPKYCWKIPISTSYRSFINSGLGISIDDKTTDYSIAEVVFSSNLYIHHGINRQDNDTELKLFRELLLRSKEHLTTDPVANFAQKEQETAKVFPQKLLDIFMTKNNDSTEILKKSPAELITNRKDTKEYSDIKTVNQIREQILKENIEKRKSKVKTDLKQISIHSKCRNLQIIPDNNSLNIIIDTTKLKAIDTITQQKHILPALTIVINSTNVNVFLFGQSTIPRVANNILWDTKTAIKVQQLLIDDEYYSIFTLIIDLIENKNQDCFQKFLENSPVAS